VNDDWITTNEAADLSGYHVNYIRQLIRRGAIHARKFGTIWQVSQSSLEAYVESATKSEDGRHGPHPRD
jgi:excisionase family DNA binding protein